MPDDPQAQPLSDVLIASDDTAEPAGLATSSNCWCVPDRGTVVRAGLVVRRPSFEPTRVEELAEQFPLALIEMTSDGRGRRLSMSTGSWSHAR